MRWLGGILDSMDLSLNNLGDNEGQGYLACCSPWVHKELDMTEQLNNNNNKKYKQYNVWCGCLPFIYF